MKKRNKFEVLNHTRETHKSKSKKYKYIYAISSVDAKDHHSTRTWSFWTTLKKAIDSGVHGWQSNGKPSYEFFAEQMYYTHIVVEKIPIDHPLMCGTTKEDNVWFKIIPVKIKKEGKNRYWCEEYAVEKIECPKEFEGICGFAG